MNTNLKMINVTSPIADRVFNVIENSTAVMVTRFSYAYCRNAPALYIC